MRAKLTGRAVAVAAALLMAACSGGTGGTRAVEGTTRPSATTVIHCEPAIAAPADFEPTKTTEIPVDGHTGVRRSYRDAGGRTLHFTAGVRGEFGEGADLIDTPTLASGSEARLYGAGGIWVLVWDEGGACGAMAVTGEGFARGEFVALLSRIGLV